MAEIPTPRSYSQITGEMIDALLSRLGLPSIRVGSPALSIIEAAAQSDLRSSQDIFNLLNSISLDRATGLALDRIGADEETPRIAEAPSTGLVTVGDTTFDKLQTRIFQGTGAPIVGSQTVNVEDALLFPASGNVYFGRGTTNVEGPIAYINKINNGTYWTLTLSTGTQKFHNLGETVILAQGGNRSIAAGSTIQTPQGNAGTTVQFTTLYVAVIPDGETEVSSVSVVAQLPGIVGNVIAGAISSFITPPFTGASVTNPAPLSNGINTEDDQTYRERIRAVRQSRSRGTALALKTFTIGITALDENKRVLSSSVVVRQDEPVTLYIDDGTGYEEKTEGIALEVIAESASGGEQYFQLANGRPVAKAQVTTTTTAPFNLAAGSQLAVAIGGIRSEHTFSADDFQAISNASTFEVVSSINANPNILFSARTIENGTKVAVFAKSDTNEDVEVLSATTGFTDANGILGFPSGRIDTLRLYKDDRLLTKDGKLASLSSKAQGLWDAPSIISGATLTLEVDGISLPASITTVLDADFVNAGTSYTNVNASNSLESWAQVWNYKLPGITCTVSGSTLVFTSNSGRSDRSHLSISGGTLAVAMWGEGESSGQDSDYTLDRNLGHVKTKLALGASNRLTAGSLNTRGFVESPSFQTLTVDSEVTSVAGQNGAELWVVVDGAAELVNTGIGPGTPIAITLQTASSWGDRVRYTSAQPVFINAAVGDYLIVTDTAVTSVDNRGAYRIARVDVSGGWVEVERPTAWAAVQSPSFTLNTGGIKVVRTPAEPQRVYIPNASNYTALSLVNAIQPQLRGATAHVYRTTRIRIRTNTFGDQGDLAVVAANGEGVALGFPITDAEVGGVAHLASIVAGHPQSGTPNFSVERIASAASKTVFTVTSLGNLGPAQAIQGLRALPDAGPISRYSDIDNHVTAIEVIAGNVITVRQGALQYWLPEDRIYGSHLYDISPRDQLAITVDGDEISKRYVMNMYRRLKPVGTTYGLTNTFTDADNGNLSLAKAFGINFDWTDFAIYMKARAKALNILWRYYRHGLEGNNARVQYSYPVVANGVVGLDYTSLSTTFTDISVRLPAGAARTGMQIRNSSKLGYIIQGPDGNSLYTYTFYNHLVSSTATRLTNVTTLTLTLPSPLTDHGLQIGDAIWFQSTDGNFTTGTKIISGRTLTTISFVDTAADVGPIATPGRVSFDPAGEVSLLGSTVIVGDIFHFDLGGSYSFKLKTVANDRTTADYPTNNTAVGTVATWFSVIDTNFLSWFPIGSGNTQTAIVAAVNALGSIISGVDLGGGSPINYATYEAPANGLGNNNGGLGPWYYLADGRNQVRSTVNPLIDTNNFTFTFKTAVTAGLATGSDWANEDVRIVPITALNVVNYLNSAAVGGLFSTAEIAVSSGAQRPQVTSLTAGTGGSLQVAGGTSNSVTAEISGGSTQVSTMAVSSIPVADADGLMGNSWVSLTNALPAPKTVITALTALTSITTGGIVTVSGAPAWTWANTATGAIDNRAWMIEKQGDFTAFVWSQGSSPALAGINEGDWVVIAPCTTPPGGTVQANSLNLGQFRVVRVDDTAKIFWIENTNVVEELGAVKLSFYDYDSIMPGDSLTINTTLWGVDNTGTWSVASIDPTNTFIFTLDVAARTPIAQGAVAALGANSSLIQVFEGQPSRLIKQIHTVNTNPSNTNLSDIKWKTAEGYRNIGATFGTVLRALDKFQFGIDTSTGISQPLTIGADGYAHNTGLIEEANRVVYGDETDPSTYPGVAAAGASVNINGPLVRRVQISLALRVKTGISTTDIEDKVKSGVAAVVNKAPVGTPVALSDVVSAAQDVNGVIAVTILSPTYGSGNDLIPVQPFEKPLVINVDQDVLVSFVGE